MMGWPYLSYLRTLLLDMDVLSQNATAGHGCPTAERCCWTWMSSLIDRHGLSASTASCYLLAQRRAIC